MTSASPNATAGPRCSKGRVQRGRGVVICRTASQSEHASSTSSLSWTGTGKMHSEDLRCQKPTAEGFLTLTACNSVGQRCHCTQHDPLEMWDGCGTKRSTRDNGSGGTGLHNENAVRQTARLTYAPRRIQTAPAKPSLTTHFSPPPKYRQVGECRQRPFATRLNGLPVAAGAFSYHSVASRSKRSNSFPASSTSFLAFIRM